MKKNMRRASAFTLIELLIIIIIIGILVSIVLPRIITSRTEANEAAIRKILHETRNAMQQYKATNNSLPLSSRSMVSTLFTGPFSTHPVNGLNAICRNKTNSACEYGTTGACVDTIDCNLGQTYGTPINGKFGWVYHPTKYPYFWTWDPAYRHL